MGTTNGAWDRAAMTLGSLVPVEATCLAAAFLPLRDAVHSPFHCAGTRHTFCSRLRPALPVLRAHEETSMSVRLSALVCFAGLTACSHQPVTAIKAPGTLPSAPVAGPPSTPDEQAPQASADLRTTRSEPSSDSGRDADLDQRERIRRLSMADGSL